MNCATPHGDRDDAARRPSESRHPPLFARLDITLVWRAVTPELIDQLDVKDAVVTIDAMGCQKKIAEKTVDSQSDYVPAVKENRPKLHEAIKEVFSEDREDDLLRVQVRQHETSDKGHGRENQHCYVPAKVPDDFPMKSAWPGLKAIGMAVRVSTKSDGTTSCDVRYYIASRFLSGKRFAEAVRGHWGIENSLHRVLDVSFSSRR